MILRKPYAMFIKHFKTIHIILSLLMAFLLYRTTLLITFFNEYLKTSSIYVDPNAPDVLFPFVVFLVPILIIIISIAILVILYIKKKSILFYVLNIIVYVVLIIIYSVSVSTINEMIDQIVLLKIVKMISDLLLLIIFIQFLTTIRVVIYSIGFDIKKFNFGQDLAQLEIKEEDSEEFEFEINVDTNKIDRDFRRRFRFSKYVYVENRFLITNLIIIFIGIVGIIIYFNQNVYNKFYEEGSAFQTSDFLIRISKSYVTKNNPQGEIRSRPSMSFVVVELDMLRSGVPKKKVDIARMKLIVNNKAYYHSFGWNNLVNDIGYIYSNEDVPRSFAKYLFVYEVPDGVLEKGKISFKYLDTFKLTKIGWQPKYINVKLEPRILDKIKGANESKLGEELVFNDSILGMTSFKINDFSVKPQYKLDYNFCPNENECYLSSEYIKPDIYNVKKMSLLLG